MYPTSMRINEEGRLVVNFKTEARFRGQFVMSHPGKIVAPTCTHTYPKFILCGHPIQAASYWITLWPTSFIYSCSSTLGVLPVWKCQRSFQQMSKWPFSVYSQETSSTNKTKDHSTIKKAETVPSLGLDEMQICMYADLKCMFLFRNHCVIHGDLCWPPRADVHSRPGQNWAYIQPAHAAVEFCLRLCSRLSFQSKYSCYSKVTNLILNNSIIPTFLCVL